MKYHTQEKNSKLQAPIDAISIILSERRQNASVCRISISKPQKETALSLRGLGVVTLKKRSNWKWAQGSLFLNLGAGSVAVQFQS